MPIILNGTTGITTPGITNTGTFTFQGVVELPAGTASAPSLTTTGDTNTGIYFPAADQVAITTDGTQRVLVDASGNVSLSTSAPALFVGSTNVSTGDCRIEIGTGRTGNGNGYIDIVGDATYTDYGLRIIRLSTGANAGSQILHRGTGLLTLQTNDAAAIQFATNSTERMRLDASGNLGLGTTSPGGRLQVVSADNTNTTAIGSFDAANQTQRIQIGFQSIAQYSASDPIRFLYNGLGGTEICRMTSDGRVGIGTTSPSELLHVKNASSSAVALVEGYAFGAEIKATLQASAGNLVFVGSTTNHNFGFLTNNTERARITTGGALCVNTTNSNFFLNVAGTASAHFGDEYDGTNYGVVQITRVPDQPDTKFHLAYVRAGQVVAGMGFLDNSNTFAIINENTNSGSGVGLTRTATSWSTVSDERKKDILGNVNNATDKLALWRSIYFKYKTDKEDVPQRIGLIAQDVLATVPEAVSIEEDEAKTLQLRYTELIPVLVKAIQELKAELDQLKGTH